MNESCPCNVIPTISAQFEADYHKEIAFEKQPLINEIFKETPLISYMKGQSLKKFW